jgi:hypothetical protein
VSCTIEIGSLLPWAKIAKLTRLFKHADEAADIYKYGTSHIDEAASGWVGSPDDLAAVERHLGSIDAMDYPPNQAMLDRIAAAQSLGRPLTEAEQNFLRHELTEADALARGMSVDEAHQIAGLTHPTYGNYDPEVIKAFPEYFNSNWFKYWGIGP